MRRRELRAAASLLAPGGGARRSSEPATAHRRLPVCRTGEWQAKRGRRRRRAIRPGTCGGRWSAVDSGVPRSISAAGRDDHGGCCGLARTARVGPTGKARATARTTLSGRSGWTRGTGRSTEIRALHKAVLGRSLHFLQICRFPRRLF